MIEQCEFHAHVLSLLTYGRPYCLTMVTDENMAEPQVIRWDHGAVLLLLAK